REALFADLSPSTTPVHPGQTVDRGLGAAAALAQHPAPLPLGEAAPHTVLLPGGQGELHTGLTYGAHPADHLRLDGQAVVVGRRIEHHRVAAPAQADGPPVLAHRPAHLLRAVLPLQDRTTHDSISPRRDPRKLIRRLFPFRTRAMPGMSKFAPRPGGRRVGPAGR